mmetsp:Transcript_11706/g.21646  ORF Transcript_11706/g.21646 Transcript_11706/m.21646 type:complete len:368 (-) Transcript_11706:54-1157(-)|eukprot:CAMPEP_0201926884 /NCGR_PEP_ID=MMETSP0903-20130614/17224_1 /ASSEMBLY_ACC=CAM_ASM_000552 /TAXON_ID=420261 /ORGANISM="Thalassiosira antarctica, Strain CCMP982" /LENGTH=367 /DNA_ID=CAMNT_0048464899 /DNA_START=66 /DNA_END=1169 /DNA_ORIENTATION=+
MKRHAIVASLLLSISSGVESQQHIKLYTTSAKFNANFFNLEPGRTFSTNQHFQFESATSKLFHTELSIHASGEDENSHVVVTSVHVERMGNDDAATANLNYDGDATTATTVTLESVVSVTFSDVGLYKAVKRSPIAGGWEDKTAPDVATILTKTVSSSDLLNVLIAADLITDDATVELSFAEFDGSPDERGVTTTPTEIVSKHINDGWPMFFAGVMITLLFVSIASVVFWLFKKESGHWPFTKNSADDGSCNSVHYEGDIDLEVTTTASGVLGLKGHHPNNENIHPNKAYRRKRRGVSSSSKTHSTTDVSTVWELGSPKTQKSGGMSVSSKHPLGITSMRKLDTFLTPQKPKSDRVQIYDIERLTRT